MSSVCSLIRILSLFASLRTFSALVVNKSKRQEPQSNATEEKCKPMFAAVLTTPDRAKRRKTIRGMWKHQGPGWGKVEARFVMCKPDHMSSKLKKEMTEHADLLFLDCEEGYLNGALTRKVRLAMKSFLQQFNHTFFMKVDDDTFISARRLCNLFTWREEQGKDNLKAYFGVFAEGPRENIYGEHVPIRDPSSQWYEPVEKFGRDVYPVSAKGGPGYILSRDLVRQIIENGIAEGNELNNEDKAVGVWVDELIQQGEHVDIVNLPGTDGYKEHADSFVTAGTFKTYHLALHHHLSADRIRCLHRVDRSQDPERHIDHCFKDDTSGIAQEKAEEEETGETDGEEESDEDEQESGDLEDEEDDEEEDDEEEDSEELAMPVD